MPNLAALLGGGVAIAFVLACACAWALAVIRILFQSGGSK